MSKIEIRYSTEFVWRALSNSDIDNTTAGFLNIVKYLKMNSINLSFQELVKLY